MYVWQQRVNNTLPSVLVGYRVLCTCCLDFLEFASPSFPKTHTKYKLYGISFSSNCIYHIITSSFLKSYIRKVSKSHGQTSAKILRERLHASVETIKQRDCTIYIKIKNKKNELFIFQMSKKRIFHHYLFLTYV